MTAKKIPVVRYEPALISEEDCEPRIGFIPFQDGDWVSFADYEAAIARAEAAERDALRWRFVRDNWHDLCTTAGIDANGNYSVTEVFIGVGEHEPYALGSVDAAIDAAIAEQQALSHRE